MKKRERKKVGGKGGKSLAKPEKKMRAISLTKKDYSTMSRRKEEKPDPTEGGGKKSAAVGGGGRKEKGNGVFAVKPCSPLPAGRKKKRENP